MATHAYSQYEMHIFAYHHYLPPCYMSMMFNKVCYYSIYRLTTQLPVSLFLQVCPEVISGEIMCGRLGSRGRAGGVVGRGGGVVLLTVGKYN